MAVAHATPACAIASHLNDQPREQGRQGDAKATPRATAGSESGCCTAGCELRMDRGRATMRGVKSGRT